MSEAKAAEAARDLLTGRWRSQILHAGVKLGVVDAVAAGDKTAPEAARILGLDPSNAYRLMRALASIGILTEDEAGRFALTDAGAFFTSGHPNSMRGVCLWEEGEVMYRAWRHLPEVVREGGADGFKREFDQALFDRVRGDEVVGELFNAAMTSYSQVETEQVLAALADFDASGLAHVCDIAGGRGHLLGHFLQRHPHLQGTVFELPETLEDPEVLLAKSLGVDDRCRYVAGDMFGEAPAADAYLLKHILHDWNDDECVQILSVARRASEPGARVLIAEYVVPGPDQPDFAKLFDIHMMAVLTGRERTEEEYAQLLDRSGWSHTKTWRQPAGSMSVVEGVAV